ncbi:MAG: polymer-forming cytoskeletal protein [Pseudomonadota bacterium]|jgi:hypothetical protein|nr:MAG: hypothetical protein DIU56_02430 [Pseudomonadota bacterium]
MRILLTVLVVMSFAAPAWADEEASRRIGNDLFHAGRTVDVSNDVPGDALLAGNRVSVRAGVGGDLAAAGRTVSLRAPVGEDVYAAGETVTLSSQVSGSARIAAGTIEITSEASIADGASLAGGEIEFDGHSGRYLQIAGNDIRLNGRVDGDVEVSGNRLRIGPEAVVRGSVTFRGPRDAEVAEGAQIAGGVRNVPAERRSGEHGPGRLFGFFAIVWLLGWAIVGALLLALLPGATRTLTNAARERPWLALLIGFALLVSLPAAAFVLGITVVGIPLALLIVCLYLVLLPLGYLTALAAISDSVLTRVRGPALSTGLRIGAFVLALIVAYLVIQIPFIGPLIGFLLLLAGMGGLALSFTRLWRRSPPPAAAGA